MAENWSLTNIIDNLKRIEKYVLPEDYEKQVEWTLLTFLFSKVYCPV